MRVRFLHETLWVGNESVIHWSYELREADSVHLNIYPRRLMEKPGGYGPSVVRSNRAGDAVTVAEMAMHRIVVPDYAGSNPVSHPDLSGSVALPAFCLIQKCFGVKKRKDIEK